MKNRKQLPDFGYLPQIQYNHQVLVDYLNDNALLDHQQYTDIKVSANSSYKNFVVANEFCKDSFFKEEEAEMMEGELYKQLYLTEIEEKFASQVVEFKYTNIFERTKRLKTEHSRYLPQADERNYGRRNNKVKGPVASLLDQFKSPLARVRLAYLAPNFSIKPHVDYDPSYITRIHIPLITNEKCTVSVYKNNNINRKHLAPGRVYFLNSGHKHSAENNSEFSRIHLIVDLQNQDDLEFLVAL